MEHEHKVYMVTGATDGIGKATAELLARTGAAVLLHGRDRNKCEAVARELSRRTGNRKLRCYVADYRSLAEVERAAESIASCEPRLDVLINNAGIGSGKLSDKVRKLSGDGHELRLAVNYLAPYLLTRRLVPLLRSSAPARIVNVASVGQKQIALDNLMLENKYDPFEAYKQSKLALILFTFELAERLKPAGVTVNCLHPGSLLNAKMVRESLPFAFGSAKSGAECVAHLALSPGLSGVTGRYYDQKTEARAHPQAYDRRFRQLLWSVTAKLTGLSDDDEA